MDIKKYWEIIDLFDWYYEEKSDDLVMKPAIVYLAGLDDEEIFEFDNIMSKLLFDIDGDRWYPRGEPSGDSFLYIRCIAVINGKDYYNAVLNNKSKLDPDMEFESVISLPMFAWSLKHGKDPIEYPHLSVLSKESFSNTVNWKHLNKGN